MKPEQAARRDQLAIEYAQGRNGIIADPEIAAETHFAAGYDAGLKDSESPANKYNWTSDGPNGCDAHNIEHPCGRCLYSGVESK